MLLLDKVTATGPGEWKRVRGVPRTFQAQGKTTSGTGTAVIDIEVSNDGVNPLPLPLETFRLSLTANIASPGPAAFESDAQYDYVRGNVKTLTGTGAEASLLMGI